MQFEQKNRLSFYLILVSFDLDCGCKWIAQKPQISVIGAYSCPKKHELSLIDSYIIYDKPFIDRIFNDLIRDSKFNPKNANVYFGNLQFNYRWK